MAGAEIPDIASFSDWSAWWVLVLTMSGIAAGIHGMSVLIGWIGDEGDRQSVRVPIRWAFALAGLGTGLVLMLRMTAAQSGESKFSLRPEESIRAGGWWIGIIPWNLAAVTVFCGLSVIASWGGSVEKTRRNGWSRVVFRIGALLAAVGLGAALGQRFDPRHGPLWPDQTWISPLLLGSSASMGLACLVLLGMGRMRPRTATERLERMDLGATVLQGICLIGLALGLQGHAVLALSRWPGVLIPAFVVPVGWVLPMALRRLAGERGAPVAAILVLIGGVALRVALVGTPGALLVPR